MAEAGTKDCAPHLLYHLADLIWANICGF